MYYVYYIKGIKIGCTKNLKKRVEQEQGYKDYTILFKSKEKELSKNKAIKIILFYLKVKILKKHQMQKDIFKSSLVIKLI